MAGNFQQNKSRVFRHLDLSLKCDFKTILSLVRVLMFQNLQLYAINNVFYIIFLKLYYDIPSSKVIVMPG